MLGQRRHQSQVAPPPPPSPLDLMGPEDLALILRDPDARAQFIARLTDAHAENDASRNGEWSKL